MTPAAATPARRLTVLGDQVVSIRALDDAERAELRREARLRLGGVALFLALVTGSALAVWWWSPLGWFFLIPSALHLRWDYGDARRAAELIADLRHGQVLIFASVAGRSERLAASGIAWRDGEGKSAWRSS